MGHLDRHTHPTLKVCTAVKASSSIPFVFSPPVINDAIYVDGMLQGNLPVSAFPGRRVLAFHLASAEDQGQQDGVTLRSLAGSIMDILLNSAQRKYGINFASFAPGSPSCTESSPDGLLDILVINTGDSGVLETYLNDTQILEMIERGRDAAIMYLHGLQQRRRTFGRTTSPGVRTCPRLDESSNYLLDLQHRETDALHQE